MANLHYLTVQDVLWINLQVTKKVHHFNYARLEEASAYQYAYGESNSLLPQAGRFLSGFLKMRPLDAGNEATAFVAAAAFVAVNGRHWTLPDHQGREWFDRVLTRQIDSARAIEEASATSEHAAHRFNPDVRGAVQTLMEQFPMTVSELANGPAK